MSKDFDNVGVLFKNDKRDRPESPTHKGKLRVNGVDFWLSAWTNQGKDGPYLKISVNAKEAAPEPAVGDVF